MVAVALSVRVHVAVPTLPSITSGPAPPVVIMLAVPDMFQMPLATWPIITVPAIFTVIVPPVWFRVPSPPFQRRATAMSSVTVRRPSPVSPLVFVHVVTVPLPGYQSATVSARPTPGRANRHTAESATTLRRRHFLRKHLCTQSFCRKGKNSLETSAGQTPGPDKIPRFPQTNFPTYWCRYPTAFSSLPNTPPCDGSAWDRHSRDPCERACAVVIIPSPFLLGSASVSVRSTQAAAGW